MQIRTYLTMGIVILK